MKKSVILFDFHNTLATCDAWLELEIKSLPGLVLQRLSDSGLIKAGPGEFERAAAAFRQLRQGVRESGIEVSAVTGVAEVLHRLGYDVAEGDVEEAVTELEDALLPQVEMLPGADHVLTRLRDAGYRLGVVSSAGYPPFVELALEKLGLRAYFNVVVTTAGEGVYKSDPEIYRRAVAYFDALPDESVHIGDHLLFDVRTAKAAGLSAIWLVAEARRTAELRGERWEGLEDSGADVVIDSLGEVFDAVQSLT